MQNNITETNIFFNLTTFNRDDAERPQRDKIT
jgi:hypothetical protein